MSTATGNSISVQESHSRGWEEKLPETRAWSLSSTLIKPGLLTRILGSSGKQFGLCYKNNRELLKIVKKGGFFMLMC